MDSEYIDIILPEKKKKKKKHGPRASKLLQIPLIGSIFDQIFFILADEGISKLWMGSEFNHIQTRLTVEMDVIERIDKDPHYNAVSFINKLLYPRNLCRRVYSFRFSVLVFVCNSGTFVK